VRHLSLLAFTLLVQLAVGAFLTLGALNLQADGPAGDPAARAILDGVLIGIGLAMALALLASTFHLGAPAAAWRAIRNLRTSWLSREVLLTLLFTLLGGLLSLLRRSGAASPTLQAGVAVAAGACGIGLVYAMASVYRLRTVPHWDTARTTASFFVTTLLLGPLAVATALAVLPGAPEALLRPPMQVIAAVAAAGFGVELAQRGSERLQALRRALLLVGLALCALVLLTAGRATGLLVAAFAAALAAQGIGRYQFYAVGPRRPL